MNKKVTLKRVRPNPLFEDWVANLYEEARSKKSKLEPMLKEAMESLEKYPLLLKSGENCKVLKGFRKELCMYLDKCMEQYKYNTALSQYCESRCDDNAIPPISPSSPSIHKKKYLPQSLDTISNSGSNHNNEGGSYNTQSGSLRTNSPISLLESASTEDVANCNTQTSSVNPTNSRAKKTYQPAHRSGAYAILVPLLDQALENPDKPLLTKEELIEKAQNHSEESFVRSPISLLESASTEDVANCNTQTSSVNPTNSRAKKTYQPAHRSGAYAILVPLLDQALENPDKPLLTKEELIEKAQNHSEESFVRSPISLLESASTEDVANCNTQTSSVNPTNSRAKKTYQPAHRSGAYAILVALLEQVLENPDKPLLTKEELIEKAQKHSEESFVRPKPGSFYNAWSNMTRLVTKGLVKKYNTKKAAYSLTEEGQELARRMLEQTKSIPTVNDLIFNDMPSSHSGLQVQNDNIFDDKVSSISQNINDNNNIIEMAPGTFDIILLIDKNETGGLKKKNDPTVAQFNKYPDLKHEYRSLKVGDFTWIARDKVNEKLELVLPYIVERKRMDDLGASIKDGRFHEQKFRLRKCGLSNVIYMVEDYGKNKHVGLPIQSLMQALANTRVQDGFKVHMTHSLTHSAQFLAMMTKRLTIRYEKKQLRGCNTDPSDNNLMTFEYFNKSSAKTKALTVTETFIKLLLQIKGVSVEKALAITSKYPTPRSLIVAYAKCDRKEGECLLAHLKYGDLNRNVGPITSKSIYQLFSESGNE